MKGAGLKAVMRPTALGKLAMNIATAIIHAIPKPTACRSTTSGMASSASCGAQNRMAPRARSNVTPHWRI